MNQHFYIKQKCYLYKYYKFGYNIMTKTYYMH